MIPVFSFIQASAQEVPILVSVPHCGTAFPSELKSQYKPDLIKAVDDTDWFVDQLYSFAPSLGISMVTANYSRWVIDLNRDPQSKPLYNDGRVITALCPTTNFLGESIYDDGRNEVSTLEVNDRIEKYYAPYHQKLEIEINRLKQKFGKVLLWDCHSIRQFVPSIHQEKFPDLILGDADGTSAATQLIRVAVDSLEQSVYSFRHNHPFKGGYITRHFGKPDANVHALQLEMSKVNYMDDAEMKFSLAKATKMQTVLNTVFENLIRELR